MEHLRAGIGVCVPGRSGAGCNSAMYAIGKVALRIYVFLGQPEMIRRIWLGEWIRTISLLVPNRDPVTRHNHWGKTFWLRFECLSDM
jgi:hypothetical protein